MDGRYPSAVSLARLICEALSEQSVLDARKELLGGFVGEGDRQQLMDGIKLEPAFGPEECVRGPELQRERLTRTSPSRNEQRTGDRRDDALLGIVAVAQIHLDRHPSSAERQRAVAASAETGIRGDVPRLQPRHVGSDQILHALKECVEIPFHDRRLIVGELGNIIVKGIERACDRLLLRPSSIGKVYRPHTSHIGEPWQPLERLCIDQRLDLTRQNHFTFAASSGLVIPNAPLIVEHCIGTIRIDIDPVH